MTLIGLNATSRVQAGAQRERNASPWMMPEQPILWDGRIDTFVNLDSLLTVVESWPTYLFASSTSVVACACTAD